MTQLAWDEVGERLFETGVDRGVLYLPDGSAVAWNGLTSIEEESNRESQSFFLDGVKYLERQTPGDFIATLKAFTYPQEFDELNGVVEVFEGLSYHNQQPKAFSLSYRTRVGNDVNGVDHGYKIHILYNVIAVPSTVAHQTLSDSSTPTDFSWTLKGTPKLITGYRPTIHVSIDSTRADPERLAAVEELLYGSDTVEPSLPDIDILTQLYDNYNDLVIIDNGDGTWTAVDAGDQYITMLDADTFSIDSPSATYLDADTYEISSVEPD